MAITTQLVGKLGGGLSWTKVTGAQKSIAWNATPADLVVTSATLGTGKNYLFAMKYTYTSGNPTDCYFAISERTAGQMSNYWAMNGPSDVTTGTRQYQLMVARVTGSSGIVEVKFSPKYQSGTHVVSADLYYTELPTV